MRSGTRPCCGVANGGTISYSIRIEVVRYTKRRGRNAAVAGGNGGRGIDTGRNAGQVRQHTGTAGGVLHGGRSRLVTGVDAAVEGVDRGEHGPGSVGVRRRRGNRDRVSSEGGVRYSIPVAACPPRADDLQTAYKAIFGRLVTWQGLFGGGLDCCTAPWSAAARRTSTLFPRLAKGRDPRRSANAPPDPSEPLAGLALCSCSFHALGSQNADRRPVRRLNSIRVSSNRRERPPDSRHRPVRAGLVPGDGFVEHHKYFTIRDAPVVCPTTGCSLVIRGTAKEKMIVRHADDILK